MASIQKRKGPRGTAYRVQYRDQLGHQAVRTFRTLADARAYKAKVEHQRPDDILSGRRSLDDVLSEMRATSTWSDATLRQQGVYVRALRQVDPDLFSVDVGKLPVSRMERAVSGVQAPNLSRRCRVFLNQLLRHAGRPIIPSKTVRTRADRMANRRAPERPLETAEVEAILEHLPDRYRCMVTLGAYVGLRPGELYGLRLEDFDSEADTLTIQRAVSRGKVGPTKTGETRTVPIGGLGDLLHGHISQYQPQAFLFTNNQGRVLHENTFVPIFKRAVAAAGVPNQVSPNSLRHHAAAWMIRRGANVLQVSRMLGHARPSITLDVYAYLFSDSLDEIAAILPGPLALPGPVLLPDDTLQ